MSVACDGHRRTLWRENVLWQFGIGDNDTKRASGSAGRAGRPATGGGDAAAGVDRSSGTRCGARLRIKAASEELSFVVNRHVAVRGRVNWCTAEDLRSSGLRRSEKELPFVTTVAPATAEPSGMTTAPVTVGRPAFVCAAGRLGVASFCANSTRTNVWMNRKGRSETARVAKRKRLENICTTRTNAQNILCGAHSG